MTTDARTPARRALDAAMTEEAFEDWLVELACRLGWAVHVERKARSNRGWRTPIKGHKGFPDVVLAKGARILFRELKSERGVLEPAQEEWRDRLLAAGADWAMWQPRDRDAIEKELLR